MALIEEFSSLDELAYMSTDELVDYIRKKGKNHFENPEEIAEAVQRAAKNSYRPPQVIADAAKQMLAISMNTIRLLQKQIKEYDKAIEKMLEAFPQTLTSSKALAIFMPPESLLRSVILTVSPVRQALRNMPVLSELSISPVTLKLRISA